MVLLNRKWVVYLCFPTSNRNRKGKPHLTLKLYIFVFLHQTATDYNVFLMFVELYIFVFLHQTATTSFRCSQHRKLYIFVFLHQTATHQASLPRYSCCISLFSYIKPQLTDLTVLSRAGCISLFSYIKPQLIITKETIKHVVYLCFPTSNRNLESRSTRRMPVVYLCFPTSNRNTITFQFK